MKTSILLITAGALAVLSVLLYELALASGPRIAAEVAIALAGVGLVALGLTRDVD